MNGFAIRTPRRAWALLAVLAALILLAACSDNDDGSSTCPGGAAPGANQICFAVDEGAQVTRDSGVNGGAFTVSYDISDGKLTLGTAMTNAVTNPNLELTVSGNAAGSYSFGAESAGFTYTRNRTVPTSQGPTDSIWLVNTTTCAGQTALSVYVNQFGAVGEPVMGTFVATTVEYDFDGSLGGGPHRVYCNPKAVIRGAFNVTRGADTP
jgi:hypothetical protein